MAGANPDGEYCCRSDAVMSSTGPAEALSKDERLNAMCGRSTQTNWEISGVEMMDLELEILRQWMKVSSKASLVLSQHSRG